MANQVTIEKTILENLLTNEEFYRKTLPHLKDEYFSSKVEKILFNEISRFHTEFHKTPNKKILKIFLDEYTKFKQDELDLAMDYVESFSEIPDENLEWLMSSTEKFCRDSAIFNGIKKSIAIMDGVEKNQSEDAIPKLLSDALAVSFDKTIGHDYFEDYEYRFDSYNLKEDLVPFKVDILNKITRGGVPRKTLNCILAPTNCGKSALLCDFSAGYIEAGFNVLYITMEMAEIRISERIDCNLLNIPIGSFQHMKKEDFQSKFKKLKTKNYGRLVVKEYPTSSAHAGHFKSLLDELKTKKNFVPDVVCIDYLNICASQRYKAGSNYNSYFAMKSIAEELRGLAVEYNFACWTATQTNRSGWSNSDLEMSDTSESAGIPMTLDFFLAMTRSEELDQLNQVLFKQLKSRYNDVNYYRKFVLGVDLKTFKYFDVEDSTGGMVETGKTDKPVPVFDKSKFNVKQRNYQELDFE